MAQSEPIALAWSGGKDSSLALDALRQNPKSKVVALVTTLTESYNRISMHGVRRELLLAQAEAVGLPLAEVWIPPKADNATYESRMAEALMRLRDETGIRHIAFGDIFLEDLKQYREKQLAVLGLQGVFPLWKRDTRELATEFVDSGFRGITVCIDPCRLERGFIGRALDSAFFAELPPNCDPCGENGEYHSFVYSGPDWKREVAFIRGEIVERDSFLFQDLLPIPIPEPVLMD
jgi:uncharacterized protein (TIGR00290 family)